MELDILSKFLLALSNLGNISINESSEQILQEGLLLPGKEGEF